MDKEKDNSNIESKVTISDMVEKAAAMKQEEPKPKKRIGLGIMVAVLALLLIGGALAIGYLWGNNAVKPAPTTETNNSTTTTETTTKPENPTSTDITKGDTISIAEAEKILEKYIGAGNGVQAIPYSAFYSTFSSNFDDQQKAFLAYSSVDRDEKEGIKCVDEWYEQGQCTGKSISYDLLSKKYQSLFGDYGQIEKKNYVFHGFFYLVYDDSINAYREFILPGGGTTSIIAVHKAVSVEKSDEGMVVSLILAYLKPTPDVIGESSIDEMAEGMSLYEFTLSPYDNSYVLTAVEKIEQ